MAGTNGTAGTGLRVARPTIAVAGRDETALGQGLISLLIVQTTSGLDRCEAVFGNWGPQRGTTDFLYFDRATLEFGKAFAVKLGTATIFEGRITGLEAHFPEGRAPTIAALAEDRFQDLRMTRRTRSFADMTDAAVISQVASDHGLSPDVSLPGPTHKTVSQVNQSDLAFLRERARTLDGEVWVEAKTLFARAAGKRDGGTLELSYGGQLREFSVLADLAHQRTSVTAGGWDVAGKSALRYEATAAAIQSELGNDTGGASILGTALGTRKEVLAHTVPLTSQEAQAHAEAAFRTLARRFVVGHGVAETDARLRVGAFVTLSKLGPLFSGRYNVVEVRHLFDNIHGIRTEFMAERPGLGKAS